MAIILTIARSRLHSSVFSPPWAALLPKRKAAGDVLTSRRPIPPRHVRSLVYVGSVVTLETVISGRNDPNSGATTALKMSVEMCTGMSGAPPAPGPTRVPAGSSVRRRSQTPRGLLQNSQ